MQNFEKLNFEMGMTRLLQLLLRPGLGIIAGY